MKRDRQLAALSDAAPPERCIRVAGDITDMLGWQPRYGVLSGLAAHVKARRDAHAVRKG